MKGAVRSERAKVEEYLNKHDLQQVVNEVVNDCVRTRPDDPFQHMGALFKERGRTGKGIQDLYARVVLGTDGIEAFEVEMETKAGSVLSRIPRLETKAESPQVLDCDNFCQIITSEFRKAIKGHDPSDLETLDQTLGNLSASNAAFCVSMAAFKAGATEREMLLCKFISKFAGTSGELQIAVPWIKLCSLEGCDIGILPVGARSFQEAVFLAKKVYNEITIGETLQETLQMLMELLQSEELVEKVRMSISVKEDVFKKTNEAGENTEKNEKEPEEEGKESQNEKREILRDEARAVVKEILSDDSRKAFLAIVENVFDPIDGVDEAKAFLEENGANVVVFNRFRESLKQGEEALESPFEEKEESSSGISSEFQHPSSNGEMILVGRPFEDVKTVSDLLQLCTLNQNLEQTISLCFEETNGVEEDFIVSFSLGIGAGLIKFGKLDDANTSSKLNAMMKLEQQLKDDATFVGPRFRKPLN